jgi:hypothetical protein
MTPALAHHRPPGPDDESRRALQQLEEAGICQLDLGDDGVRDVRAGLIGLLAACAADPTTANVHDRMVRIRQWAATLAHAIAPPRTTDAQHELF